MDNKSLKVVSWVCTALTVAGTVGTAVWAVKKTPKAMEAKKLLEESKPEGVKPTVLEYAATLGKEYAGPIALGSATILSTICGQVANAKIQASLVGSLVMLEGACKKYSNQVKKILSPDQLKQIKTEMAKEDVKENRRLIKYFEGISPSDQKMYWNEYLGIFWANPSGLRDALVDFNDIIFKDGNASLLDFVDLANITLSDYISKDFIKNFGWNINYICEMGCNEAVRLRWDLDEDVWLDEDSGQTISLLDFIFQPIYDYKECQVDATYWGINKAQACDCLDNYKQKDLLVVANRLKMAGARQEEIDRVLNGLDVEKYVEMYDIAGISNKPDIPDYADAMIEDVLMGVNE